MDRRIVLALIIPFAAACPAKKDAGPSAPSKPGASASFSGDVTVAPELKDKVKDTDVLFIIARESMNGQPGRLVATQRHDHLKFPLHYEMSEKNLMVPGSTFTGPFVVNARLDKDGDPMTKGPDDLYAVRDGEVKGGESNVTLELKAATIVPGAAASQPSSRPAE
jgi:hypothetical protein